ncbi:hypothetical protein HDU98_005337 [Podochytrium sp. JEL0797]|nr:hypothetical protein HDU98_005337 [Podochytrium sp. JEL0797]
MSAAANKALAKKIDGVLTKLQKATDASKTPDAKTLALGASLDLAGPLAPWGEGAFAARAASFVGATSVPPKGRKKTPLVVLQWPHGETPGWQCSAEKIARAGMVYNPQPPDEDDYAMCPYCQLGLAGWEADDDPVVEHKRRNANCIFFKGPAVLAALDPAILRKLQSAETPQSEDESLAPTSSEITHPEEEEENPAESETPSTKPNAKPKPESKSKPSSAPTTSTGSRRKRTATASSSANHSEADAETDEHASELDPIVETPSVPAKLAAKTRRVAAGSRSKAAKSAAVLVEEDKEETTEAEDENPSPVKKPRRRAPAKVVSDSEDEDADVAVDIVEETHAKKTSPAVKSRGKNVADEPAIEIPSSASGDEEEGIQIFLSEAEEEETEEESHDEEIRIVLSSTESTPAPEEPASELASETASPEPAAPPPVMKETEAPLKKVPAKRGRTAVASTAAKKKAAVSTASHVDEPTAVATSTNADEPEPAIIAPKEAPKRAVRGTTTAAAKKATAAAAKAAKESATASSSSSSSSSKPATTSTLTKTTAASRARTKAPAASATASKKPSTRATTEEPTHHEPPSLALASKPPPKKRVEKKAPPASTEPLPTAPVVRQGSSKSTTQAAIKPLLRKPTTSTSLAPQVPKPKPDYFKMIDDLDFDIGAAAAAAPTIAPATAPAVEPHTKVAEDPMEFDDNSEEGDLLDCYSETPRGNKTGNTQRTASATPQQQPPQHPLQESAELDPSTTDESLTRGERLVRYSTATGVSEMMARFLADPTPLVMGIEDVNAEEGKMPAAEYLKVMILKECARMQRASDAMGEAMEGETEKVMRAVEAIPTVDMTKVSHSGSEEVQDLARTPDTRTESFEKHVVVGSGGVGKSCLTVRFLKDEFSNEYDPTIEENYRKYITVDKCACVVNIIDTAGQHEYTSLRDQHLKAGKGFLLVFSLTDAGSFDELKQLREQIVKLKDTKRVPIVVCGNKADIPVEQHEVTFDVVTAYLTPLKIPYLQTSAKENMNVTESFLELVRECRKIEAAKSSAKDSKYASKESVQSGKSAKSKPSSAASKKTSAGGKCVLF